MRKLLPSKPSRAALIAVALVAFLGGARSLTIGYLSDDWAILSHVSRHGNGEAWAGPWLGMESLKFHRPLFTGLYAAEYALFGAQPFPAHLHHLLWHVLAAATVFLLVQGLGASWRGALFAGVAFALHPLLPGATGWLAGRCGSVAGTLTLATVLAWLRFRSGHPGRRRGLWAAGALAAAVAAALTRESGYLALVAPLFIDLLGVAGRPGNGRILRDHAPFAGAGLLLLWLRHRALGTLGGGYPEPDGLMAGVAAILPTLEETGEALLRLFGAIPPEFAGGSLLLPIATGSATLVLLIAGLVRARRVQAGLARSIALLLSLLGAQLVLLVLAGPTLLPSTGQRWYGAIAFFVALLGVAADSLLVRARLWAPVLLLPAFVAGHVLVQDQLVAADAGVKKITAAVIAMMDEEAARRATWKPPQKLGPVFVSCLPESRMGLPTFQWGFAESLRPPFRDREPPGTVYPVHQFMYLGREKLYPVHPPIEPLLHVQGTIPLALGLVDPWRNFEDRLQIADVAKMVEALGSSPPKWPLFAGEPLKILEPSRPRFPTVVRRDDFRVRVKLDAGDSEEVELFTFLPTLDRRDRVPVTGREVEFDLGAKIWDFVAFRDEPVSIYLIPVGYRAASPDRPRLGPLITFRYEP